MIQSVWWLNHGKSTWFTLSKTNEDDEIDEKKRHPRLFSGRVLINDDKCSNIYVSLQMWVLHMKPKSYVCGFLVFYGHRFYILQHVLQDLRWWFRILANCTCLLFKSLKDPFFVLVLHTNRPQGDFCYTICDGSWGGAGNICVFILYKL